MLCVQQHCEGSLGDMSMFIYIVPSTVEEIIFNGEKIGLVIASGLQLDCTLWDALMCAFHLRIL